jgi:osmotically inducible protein OsmC
MRAGDQQHLIFASAITDGVGDARKGSITTHKEASMAIAVRRAQTTWEGPLDSGTGTIQMGTGATGELPVTWAARTGRAGGKTSPEELAAAAHSACYAMALALRLGEHKAVPERLAIAATVTLDEAGGVPTIVSSHLDVTARVPAMDPADFDAVIREASDLCPVSRLFAGAKITVEATLEPAA